ncbi:MAG: S9 family peptidase [Actinobacteria bacterium]|nr:S9 family peptidase [Actinomycetota bacterium]
MYQLYETLDGQTWQDQGVTESFPRQSAATRNFQLGAPRSFTICESGEQVLFLRSESGRDSVNSLWIYDVVNRVETKFADPRVILADDAEVPAAERARRERMRETTSGITSYSTDAIGVNVTFALSGQLFAGNSTTRELNNLNVEGPVIDPRLSPDGNFIAWSNGKDLFITDFSGKEVSNLTNERSVNTAWGLADFIASEEFGRMHGYWWSPDSDSLIIESVTDADVQSWWISDPATPAKAPQEIKYPAAGTTNATVGLERISITGEREPLRWDNDSFEYLISVSWQKDCNALITVADRAQQQFVTYSANPLGLENVHEVSDHEFVEVIPSQPRWLNNQIVSVVDNRQSDTRELQVAGNTISPAGLQVMSIVDIKDEYIDVIATQDALSRDLLRIGFDGSITEISQGGLASATATTTELQVVVESRLDTNTRSYQLRRGVKTEHYFDSLAETPNFTSQVHVLQTGPHKVNTAVIFPQDHVHGSKKLPVLMRPYGGPHGPQVQNGALSYAIDQWFADQGFVVVIADNRGTGGRGPAWDHSIYQDFVVPVIDDQVTAIADVANHFPDDIDATRVGITGWSFGGYLSALAVMKRPDVFHAAVAGAPVTEWLWYDTAYTERYLGHPEKFPEIYEDHSLISMANQLERPLMLVHGLADDNVVAAHSLSLSGSLLANKKPHTVLPLSGVTHMTPQEIISENLMLLTVEYLKEQLGVE